MTDGHTWAAAGAPHDITTTSMRSRKPHTQATFYLNDHHVHLLSAQACNSYRLNQAYLGYSYTERVFCCCFCLGFFVCVFFFFLGGGGLLF